MDGITEHWGSQPWHLGIWTKSFWALPPEILIHLEWSGVKVSASFRSSPHDSDMHVGLRTVVG